MDSEAYGRVGVWGGGSCGGVGGLEVEGEGEGEEGL